MSRFVDSVFSFLGRRSSKDHAADPAVAKRTRGGKKAVLKADSFVFLPGECTSNGTYLWGEVITPRTVGVPVSSYSDDYSVLSGGSRRRNVRSVLVDGDGKLVGRRLSGSFVAKAVKSRKSLDEVEDGSLEAFLKEFEAEEDDERYHTYDHAVTRADDEKDIYDRLIHLPIATAKPRHPGPAEELRAREKRDIDLVLDLRDSGAGRRRVSSSGSAYTVPTKSGRETREGSVDWKELREMLAAAAIGKGTAHRKRHRDMAT